MISAEGILCMLEQIAHKQPREVAERVAKVCQRVFEIHAEGVGKATPLSFEQTTAMYRLAGELSRARDPLHHTRVSGPVADHRCPRAGGTERCVSATYVTGPSAWDSHPQNGSGADVTSAYRLGLCTRADQSFP